MRGGINDDSVESLSLHSGSQPTMNESSRSLPILTDRWERRIRYLRVSVTDRCNYRCSYCMPAEGFPGSPRSEVLSFEEVQRVVGLMAKMGVRRVRITGGEPLIRKGLTSLVGWIASLPDIEQVAMTTNGHLLERFAAELYTAGMRGLNVSIDSFDPQRFAEITRGGDLVAVLAGLHAAETAGFQNIKINAVAVKGLNDDEIASFVARCWRSGWLPRFIELMPIGGLDFQSAERRMTSADTLARLSDAYSLAPETSVVKALPAGPAQYQVVTSGPFKGKRVGLISPMSDHRFCASCNRARLTARGGLRACLADDSEVSILHAIRGGVSDEALRQLIGDAVNGKREAHRLRDSEAVPISGMTGIGG